MEKLIISGIGFLAIATGIVTVVLDRLWAKDEEERAKEKEAERASKRTSRQAHDELVDGKSSGFTGAQPQAKASLADDPLLAQRNRNTLDRGAEVEFEVPEDFQLADYAHQVATRH